MYLKYVICICAMYVCSSLNYVRFCLKLYCEILHHVACYHLLCAGLSVSISQACILSILLSFSTFFFTCKMHAIYVFRSKMYKIMHKIHLFIHNFKVGFSRHKTNREEIPNEVCISCVFLYKCILKWSALLL